MNGTSYSWRNERILSSLKIEHTDIVHLILQGQTALPENERFWDSLRVKHILVECIKFSASHNKGKGKGSLHRFQSWHHIMCSPGRQPGSPNPPSLPPHSHSSHFIACLVESNSQIPGQDSISRPNECQARALTTMPRSIIIQPS